MSSEATDQILARQRLAAKAARQRVCERELEREIYDASVIQGLTQREIGQLVGNQSQATIQRVLRRIADDPTKLDVNPADIVDQRTAGIITTAEMMEKLTNWNYSVGEVARISGVATDAYITSDWDSIEAAFYRGHLTDEEFRRLAEERLRTGLS
ncbi:hypothetical protein A5664_18040 [Mycolicibacterium fortuitum]|uniref:hypothetical protein n=1 Tax=Mycolicibacterium fortuitum TaxID=1766 RepID=UPI0007EDA8D4|nr:hypothetical protein [Mycolicibacterium fortuitum]OBI78314.1 hypothetical protein A5664_18040 [Mycolicibacterium fortuitum]